MRYTAGLKSSSSKPLKAPLPPPNNLPGKLPAVEGTAWNIGWWQKQHKRAGRNASSRT